MVKTALVNLDIVKGAEMLRILDAAKLKLSVAMWVVFSEYEDWRLLVASRQLDTPNVKDSYLTFFRTLDAGGFKADTPTTILLPMTDPTIKDLRRRYVKWKVVEGTNVNLQSFGDRWVEDSYVYRIT